MISDIDPNELELVQLHGRRPKIVNLKSAGRAVAGPEVDDNKAIEDQEPNTVAQPQAKVITA